VRWFLFKVRKFQYGVIVIEEFIIVTLEEDWSPLPHAYSRKRDFASQIAHGT